MSEVQPEHRLHTEVTDPECEPCIASHTATPRGKPPSVAFLACLNGFQLANSAVWFLLLIVIIPSQVGEMVGPESKGSGIGRVLASAVLINLLGSPVMGTVSDRCSSQWGARRPFIVAGTVGVAIAIQLLMRSRSLVEYILAYNLLCACSVVASVPFNALVVDSIHSDYRGAASGAMGVAGHLGTFVGAAAGTFYKSLGAEPLGMFMGVGLLFGTAATFAASAKSTNASAASAAPLKCAETVRGMVEPLRDHDFRWVFITRLLMQQGVYTVQEFLQYFMADAVDIPSTMPPQTAVSIAMMSLMLSATVAAGAAGAATDKMGGRRKPMVYGSSIVMAVSTICMLFSSSFLWVLAMSFCFGLGYGTFLAIDFALVMDVLPNPATAAKDLAVWHAALVLPQVMATPIGGALLDHFQAVGHSYAGAGRVVLGYQVVFVAAALYFVVAAVLVQKIRKVT